MYIDSLVLRNFRKFELLELACNRHFTLLVGDNGSGKTTILDALAIALGVWHAEIPDTGLASSKRSILRSEIRLEPSVEGDRLLFRERAPVVVEAVGGIAGHEPVRWQRRLEEGARRTSKRGAEAAQRIIRDVYRRDQDGEKPVCPVVAYYGAGRAWLPSNQRGAPARARRGEARRWAALYDSLNERIRTNDLQEWFLDETIAAVNGGGRVRPGFEAVRRAILGCIPDAESLKWDTDRKQVVMSIAGNPQPFGNLSAGQRMMLALVADIAIKAVTQNAFLLPSDALGPEDDPLPRVFALTPGVVLIDELDVHLHPKWQRRVATDLKRTFPAMQFVCTSHSPQVIGEVSRSEVRVLGADGPCVPATARGADSNWLLDHEMDGARSESARVHEMKMAVEEAMANGDLSAAHRGMSALRREVEGETGDLARLQASLDALTLLEQDGETDPEA